MINARSAVLATLENVSDLNYLNKFFDAESNRKIETDFEKFIFSDSALLIGDMNVTNEQQSFAYTLYTFEFDIWLLYKSNNAKDYLSDNITNIINQMNQNDLGLPNDVVTSYFENFGERGDMNDRVKYHKMKYIVKSYSNLGDKKADSIYTLIKFIRENGDITNVGIICE